MNIELEHPDPGSGPKPIMFPYCIGNMIRPKTPSLQPMAMGNDINPIPLATLATWQNHSTDQLINSRRQLLIILEYLRSRSY